MTLKLKRLGQTWTKARTLKKGPKRTLDKMTRTKMAKDEPKTHLTSKMNKNRTKAVSRHKDRKGPRTKYGINIQHNKN